MSSGSRSVAPSRYKQILREVCAEYGFSFEKAWERRRHRAASIPRYIAWQRLRDQGHSFPAIAAAAGRDHTTILLGIRSLAVHFARRQCRECNCGDGPWAQWDLCAACLARLNAEAAKAAADRARVLINPWPDEMLEREQARKARRASA